MSIVLPLEFELLLRKGVLKTFSIAKGAFIGPDEGRRWLILGGVIQHITGTDTEVRVGLLREGAIVPPILYKVNVDTAVASDEYDFWGEDLGQEKTMGWRPLIMTSTTKISLHNGAATSKIYIQVIEW